ncbi:MAG: hypothetical protein PHH26_00325 [Candidatus Thermoplasmatota archaeon]|nr:hypothetical protein [Candidatus Thermoplasmatota archaeon]
MTENSALSALESIFIKALARTSEKCPAPTIDHIQGEAYPTLNGQNVAQIAGNLASLSLIASNEGTFSLTEKGAETAANLPQLGDLLAQLDASKKVASSEVDASASSAVEKRTNILDLTHVDQSILTALAKFKKHCIIPQMESLVLHTGLKRTTISSSIRRKLAKEGYVRIDENVYPHSFFLTRSGEENAAAVSAKEKTDLTQPLDATIAEGGVVASTDNQKRHAKKALQAESPLFQRAHDLRFSVVVDRLPNTDALLNTGWLLDTTMTGWVRYTGGQIDGVRINLNAGTPAKVVMWLPEIVRPSALEVAGQICTYLENTLRSLKALYPTIVFSTVQIEGEETKTFVKTVSQHFALVGDAFARKCIAEKYRCWNDIFHVDMSTGVPELEAHNAESAQVNMEKYESLVMDTMTGKFDHLAVNENISSLHSTAQQAQAQMGELGAVQQLQAQKTDELRDSLALIAKSMAFQMMQKENEDLRAGIQERDRLLAQRSGFSQRRSRAPKAWHDPAIS